jgi:hypothetical protein
MPSPTVEQVLLFLGVTFCLWLFFGVPTPFWIGSN